MPYGILDTYPAPNYGRGLLDVAPAVGPESYLSGYHAANEAFRVKPVDAARWGWMPEQAAAATPTQEEFNSQYAPTAQRPITESGDTKGWGGVAQDVTAQAPTMAEQQAGAAKAAAGGQAGWLDAIIDSQDPLGAVSDYAGGLLGMGNIDPMDQFFDESQMARSVGKVAGPVGAFVSSPAALVEMGAGLLELSQINDMLAEKYGGKIDPITYARAVALGIDPTQDLRGYAQGLMRDFNRGQLMGWGGGKATDIEDKAMRDAAIANYKASVQAEPGWGWGGDGDIATGGWGSDSDYGSGYEGAASDASTEATSGYAG